ncbi:LacI family transcriptional regulator [uncultured Pleomorphomonas sp.]|uniref:LacI family transcriptional regulator n=2 Tax=Pleomorphomonas TaxID=261933 RepID=A0A2G9X0W6_9HYPH|nr:LacI family DNA-binding transcriptional regulator [Pleomorphomonas carboxyditropha]PIP00575.1 LacI family transcriptional regulator [Pleomorphomonas carboxyditropha]SCM72133.1 LacI family transcriptional regulator [uncultured Pleomorphomonas sp.]
MLDVARTAQVSVATVSALINGTTRVSPALTQRIEAAISAIGYERNAIARSLKLGATNTIGLMVSDIRNPFFTDIVATIQYALNRVGYAVMVCSSDENTELQDMQIKLLLDRAVDGLIIAPAGEDVMLKDFLASVRRPMVIVDRTCEGLDVDTVTLDNRKAVLDATSYLIGLGHRRIGYIAGPLITSTGRDRLAGYRDALAAAEVPYVDELVQDGDSREAGGYRAAMQLLTQRDRPSAIFSANNLMTIGAMRAIRDAGLSCPDDISVACFDDFPWADVFRPHLTTIAQPVQAIGEYAANLLLDRLSGKADEAPRRLVIQGRLIVRESCRALARP